MKGLSHDFETNSNKTIFSYFFEKKKNLMIITMYRCLIQMKKDNSFLNT
jgi:hypothetical protein